MPETIRIDEDLRAVVITSYGEVTQTDLENSRRSVSDIFRGRGLRRVLIDASMLTALPSTSSLFSHSAALASSDIFGKVKFAIVVSEKTKDDSAFIETVATNRGVIMKNFGSREEAMAWLKE